MAYLNVRVHGSLWAIVHLRCPRCHHGRVFHGILAMNQHCPVCLLRFEREPGYFMGAMYISYLFGSLVMVAALFCMLFFFPSLSDVWICVITFCILLLFIPAIFRYARVIWITLDRAIDA